MSFFIPNNGVLTDKITNGAVTQGKLASLPIQISSSSGTFTTTSTLATPVTNLSVTLTTTGRPVFVGLISDGTVVGSVGASDSGANGLVVLEILNGSTVVAYYKLESNAAGGVVVPSSAYNFIDTSASSGSTTYSVKIYVGAGTTTGSVVNSKLVAYEL